MRTVATTGRVDPAGELAFSLPRFPDMRGRDVDVIVIVNPVHGNGGHPDTETKESWRDFVNRAAGSWEGDFVRPEQGSFEEREQWP